MAVVNDADVIVVGSRVAGSALAIRLAFRGRNVVLVDRATFPSDTMSTHCWGPEVNARFRDLQALDAVTAAGMEPILGLRMLYGDVAIEAHVWPFEGMNRGGSLRRVHLDKALLDHARETPGVDVVEGCRVDVVLEGETAVGVRGADLEIRAPLVVGADGMRSAVAAAVGATIEDSYPTQRFGYFAYWRGSTAPAGYLVQRFLGDDVITVQPCDDGLQILAVTRPLREFASFRRDYRRNYLETAASIAPDVWRWFKNASIEGRIQGTADVPGFHRRPFGQGWALIGDAWYHKDPITALGIGDALLEAELIAPAIDRHLEGDGEAMRDAYARLRIASDPWYEWTCSVATPAPLTERTRDYVRRIAADEQLCSRLINV
ncbi:MAG TPA: NAD(P)/FAD-dependent oxidoreductase, partial [Candidatus Dormibacteraeota bacterium]|nr:NAD(P)/FAD-dependent oxidoreductase [Candidatus Dormibacteraeota bacterium]